jgi:hypothetical protein
MFAAGNDRPRFCRRIKSTDMTIHRFEIYGACVDFVDCRPVAEGFASILRGWTVREIPHDPAHPAYVTFRFEHGIYDWKAPWITGRNRRDDEPSTSLMEAVCDFHYEFIDWFTDRNPQHFCIHMAATDFGGRAVLFPAIQRTGKSTLALHCVQAGFPLLGDDVVVIDGEKMQAIALGLLPRMRLPLHPSFKPAFVDFIARHAGLSDRRWQYVELGDGQIVDHGQHFPIGGVVILDRRRDGRASIGPVAKSTALKALIDRNFGMLEAPGRIFDCFRRIVDDTDCRVLTYADPAEAVALLASTFGEPVHVTKEARHATA